MDDDQIKDAEGEKRGRRGNEKKLLGKRKRDAENDSMDSGSDDEQDRPNSVIKTKSSLTPSQRKISVQKILRDRSASRMEGSQPKRLDYKPVPEEHIRLAKKINKAFSHKIQKTEADREIQCKRPKHLFAGKMSNGKKAYR